MSLMERMSLGVLTASFCCMVAVSAVAQQATPAAERERSATRENVSDAASDGDNNRAKDQQRERTASDEVGSAEQSNRRNNRDSQTLVAGENEVEGYLVGCLLAKNGSEIQLSQFAEKQSENPEVKKFAQMMVRDHQKMVQELKQLAGTQANTSRESNQTDEIASTEAGTQQDRSRNAENSQREQVVGDNSAIENSRDGDDRAASASRISGGNHASHGSNTAIHQLAEIDRQIVELQTQATREELEQKSGADFDKCFVGGAIVAHVHMIAALQVIEQQGQGQLAEVAKQARPVAEQHLEHAKQLMKQLEPNAAKVGQAERRPAGTQR